MHPALVTAVAAAQRRDQITHAAEARRARQARRTRRTGPGGHARPGGGFRPTRPEPVTACS
jgi:hypothetical protein